MNSYDFLQKVLPTISGSACYYGLGLAKDKPIRTHPTQDINDLINNGIKLSENGYNAYFALCSFVDNTGRKAANALDAKCIWADIDAGKSDSKYKNWEEAWEALVQFSHNTKIPPSIAVRSGKGLHVYWVFNNQIPCAQWKPIATAFRQLCQEQGLDIDTACTEDKARVLRIPGTLHQSSGNLVMLLGETGVYYDPSDLLNRFNSLITTQPIDIPNTVVEEDVTPPTGNAKVIVDNCNQVRTMGTGNYKQWFLATTVLKRCVNGHDYVHELSAMDKERYNPADVDKLFANASADAPACCETFRACNPEGCKGCRHCGTIKSPIELSKKVSTVEVEQPSLAVAKTEEPRKPFDLFHKFEYPRLLLKSKYFSVDHRGIVWHKMDKGPDGELVPVDRIISSSKLYYKYCAYLKGDDMRPHRTYIFEVEHPYNNNECEEIAFSTGKDLTTTAITQWFAEAKMFPESPDISATILVMFMNAYLKAVAPYSKELATFDTLGWQEFTDPETKEKTEGFATGSGVITSTGLHDLRHGDNAKLHAKEFTAKGSLDDWKRGIGLYDTLGQYAGQLGVCMSLAAPFMRYGVGEAHSAIYSLWSAASGLGKSQLLRAAASVWGDPERQFVSRMASVAARSRRMAVLKNLPVFMDEMTDVSDEDMFNLAYTLVGGKEKDKLHSSGAKFIETGTWSTVSFTTANKSFKAAIADKAGDSDATLLRVIEYECDFKPYGDDPIINDYINQCIHNTKENYGIAGPTLMYEVMKRPDRLITLPRLVEGWIQKQKDNNGKPLFDNNERFMSSPLAITLIVARWAKEFGIIDYNIDALEAWVLNTLVPHNKACTSNLRVVSTDFIADYLADRVLDTLIVTGSRRKEDQQDPQVDAGIDKYVISRNRRNLLVRVERDDQRVMIQANDLRKWCKQNRISMQTLNRKLSDAGVELITQVRNLSQQISYIACPRTRVFELNRKSLELLGYNTEEAFGKTPPDDLPIRMMGEENGNNN